MYASVAFMPLFLVPVQVVAVRSGFGSMVKSAVVSGAVISAWQVWLLADAGMLGGSTIALGLSTPLGLLLALTLLAMPWAGRYPFVVRVMGAAAIATAASLPGFLVALEDENLRQMFTAAINGAAASLGLEGTDADGFYTTVRRGMASSYAALMFVFVFGSAWMGTRFGQRWMTPENRVSDDAMPSVVGDSSDTTALPPQLLQYRVPVHLVWGLLAAWAALLLNRFAGSFMLSAVALNAALVLSVCYGVQGLAVIGALAGRVGLAPVLRFAGPVLIIILLLSGAVGVVSFGLLVLLGTLETWIQFRTVTTKGE